MLSDEFRDLLRASGAALVGFADLRDLPSSPLPYGACVALPVPAHIVREIEDGPTMSYVETYQGLNAKLNGIVTTGAQFLTARNYRAIPVTRDYARQDDQRRTALPYKTVAVRAGMGWIGKSCLLVTPRYGSAIRMATILTDAPLECGEPVTESRCGTCDSCVRHCPAGALRGTTWSPGMDREEIFETEICAKFARKRMLELTRIDNTLCGKCFVVCPYTAKYLSRSHNTMEV